MYICIHICTHRQLNSKSPPKLQNEPYLGRSSCGGLGVAAVVQPASTCCRLRDVLPSYEPSCARQWPDCGRLLTPVACHAHAEMLVHLVMVHLVMVSLVMVHLVMSAAQC